MSRRLLAICDSEPDYARKLMERISLQEDAALQVRTFSDAGQLFQYSKKHEIDVLLMEDRYQEELRYKIPAKQRFLLARDAGTTSCGSGAEQESVIMKYQSADRILQQLLESMKEDSALLDRHAGASGRGSGRCRLVGVYSPVHRIGKTAFALQLAEQFSKEGPVLYLNLEMYSGMEYCVPIQEKEHLGDLLYYARQEQTAFGFRLSTMVCQIGGVDYIQPAPVTRDICEVRVQEWKDLLEQIQGRSIYNVVVLDLGEGIQGLFEILRLCDTVYTPYIEEAGARAKLKQYTENLRRLGFEDVVEHTVQREMVKI